MCVCVYGGTWGICSFLDLSDRSRFRTVSTSPLIAVERLLACLWGKDSVLYLRRDMPTWRAEGGEYLSMHESGAGTPPSSILWHPFGSHPLNFRALENFVPRGSTGSLESRSNFKPLWAISSVQWAVMIWHHQALSDANTTVGFFACCASTSWSLGPREGRQQSRRYSASRKRSPSSACSSFPNFM